MVYPNNNPNDNIAQRFQQQSYFISLMQKYRDTDSQVIQNRLRDKIKNSDYSLTELAVSTDFSVNTIKAVTKKIPHKLEFYTVLMLCNVLDILIEEIID